MLLGSTLGYETEFIDGSSTYYNDYAQAWRLLGFHTDCNASDVWHFSVSRVTKEELSVKFLSLVQMRWSH